MFLSLSEYSAVFVDFPFVTLNDEEYVFILLSHLENIDNQQ